MDPLPLLQPHEPPNFSPDFCAIPELPQISHLNNRLNFSNEHLRILQRPPRVLPDMKIICGGETWPAHRTVLSEMCPGLEARLKDAAKKVTHTNNPRGSIQKRKDG